MLPGELRAKYSNDPKYQSYLKWQQDTGGKWAWWGEEASTAARLANIPMYLDTTGWTSKLTDWGENIMYDQSGAERSATNPNWVSFINSYKPGSNQQAVNILAKKERAPWDTERRLPTYDVSSAAKAAGIAAPSDAGATTNAGSGTYSIPGANVYTGKKALAEQAFQQALTELRERHASALQNYGLTADVNIDGSATNYRQDPNNQYGKFQLLARSQGTQLDQNMSNTLVNRGLFGAGLGNQAETGIRFDQGLETTNLGKEWVGEISDINKLRARAVYDRDQAFWEAEHDSLLEALLNKQFENSGGNDNGGGGDDDNNDKAITDPGPYIANPSVAPKGRTQIYEDPSDYTADWLDDAARRRALAQARLRKG